MELGSTFHFPFRFFISGIAYLNYAELLVADKQNKARTLPPICHVSLIGQEGIEYANKAIEIIRLTQGQNSFLGAALSNLAGCTHFLPQIVSQQVMLCHSCFQIMSLKEVFPRLVLFVPKP